MRDLAGEWPLVGRAAIVDTVLTALARPPAALVLCGEAGVGKTRVAREVRERLTATGAQVVHLVAGPGIQHVPLGTLAPLLVDGTDRPGDLSGVLRRVAHAVGTEPSSRPGRQVLSIDDAHHLDDVSAAALAQIAGDAVGLLLTVRDGERLTDPVARLLSLAELRTVRVEALSRVDHTTLVAAALAGPISPATVDALWDRTHGNPLVLRELLYAAVDSGAVTHDGTLWALTGTLSPTDHLRALVADRLERAGPQMRSVLGHVALGEGLGHQLLAELVGVERLDEAERLGFVVVSADRRRRPVRLRHPYYREVLESMLGTGERSGILRSLASAVAAHGARRRDDAVRVAEWFLAGGREPEVAQLTAAARIAWSRRADVLAHDLAAAAVEAGGGIEAQLLLASTTSSIGDGRAAESQFSSIDLGAATDRERAEVTIARAQNLFWQLGDGAGADRVLAEAADRIADLEAQIDVIALRLSQDLLAGRTDLVVDGVTAVFEALDPADQVTAGWLLVPALVVRGRVLEAVSTGCRLARVPFGDESGEARPTDHLGLLAGVVFAHTANGDLAEAMEVAHTGLERARTAGALSDEAWFCLMVGRVELLRGRPVAAHGWFSDGERRFTEVGQRPLARWCTAGRLWAAAHGPVADGRSLARTLDESSAGAVHLMGAEELRARGWWEWRTRGRRAAASVFEAAVDLARSQQAAFLEAGALHDLLRIGHLDEPRHRRLTELADAGAGALVDAMAAHADADRRGDEAALVAVADRFERLGADLLAADAAAGAAQLARRGGRRHNATAIAQRWRTRLPDVATDLTRGDDRPGGGGPAFTDRERMAAQLAAEGSTNAEIASVFGCSPRTVETHLGSVYRKLGIRSRRELAAALRARAGEAP